MQVAETLNTTCSHVSGGINPSETAVSIARAGDLNAAADFARQQPDAAQLLGDAFGQHNLCMLHALQERVPAAFGDAGAAVAADSGAARDPAVVNLADYGIQSIRDHEATPAEALGATVPADKKGKPLGSSGVTIGYGFDLGSETPESIQAYADNGTITQEFADRIRPYARWTGTDAQDYLARHPLEFTDDDRSQINALSDTVYTEHIEGIDLNYYDATEAATGQGRHLADLPRDARTVIVDVGVQYGPTGIMTRTPDFWGQITAGRWSDAADNLHDFGDGYQMRRRDNEAMLRRAMQNGLQDGQF